MNNQENNNSQSKTGSIGDDFALLWNTVAETNNPNTPKTTSSFKPLPDGTYNGRVQVEVATVASENSPNRGLPKFIIELYVTEGEYKGNTAYHHRVIVPHNFTKDKEPPESVPGERQKWNRDKNTYNAKTMEIISNCGVELAKDPTLMVSNIAANNTRYTIVNFSVKNGIPYINHIVKKEPAKDEKTLFDQKLPNGDDAPIN